MNIEEKTKMSHEILLKILDKVVLPQDFKDSISLSWAMADAMEVEAEKRIKDKVEKDAEDAKVFFEKLTKNEDGSCKHTHTTLNGGECFDCGGKSTMADSPQLEFQVDWSVAPKSANYWSMDENTSCNWYEKDPQVIGSQWDFGNVLEVAPSFKYQGDWKDSLRKRP